MSDIIKFNKDLDKAYQEKVIKTSTEFVKRVVVEVWRTIIANAASTGFQFGSPVLTGQYYTGHRIAINRIDTSVSTPNPGGAKSPRGGLPLSRAQITLASFKLGDTVFISNSLPYAKKLEDGFSRFKTPEGIYKVAAELIKTRFKNIKVVV